MSSLVTVLIPCYNAEDFVEMSVRSILTQTYLHLDILLIDDCSTDNTAAILEKIQNEDTRVRLIRNEANLGLIATLNKGIGLAEGKYLARMDADDISAPDRIAMQVDLMEKQSDVTICGSGITAFFPEGHTLNRYYQLNHDGIKAEALFSSPFAHPAVMIRIEALRFNNLLYDFDFKYAEDYHMWIRLLKYGRGANLPAFLLKYRISPGGQTGKAIKDIQSRVNTISRIQLIALENIGFLPNEKERKFHYILSLSDNIANLDFQEYNVSFINSYFRKLVNKTLASRYCSKMAIKEAIGRKRIKIFIFNYKKYKISQLIKILLAVDTAYAILTIVRNKVNFK